MAGKYWLGVHTVQQRAGQGGCWEVPGVSVAHAPLPGLPCVCSWIPGSAATYLGADSAIPGGEERLRVFKQVSGTPCPPRPLPLLTCMVVPPEQSQRRLLTGRGRPGPCPGPAHPACRDAGAGSWDGGSCIRDPRAHPVLFIDRLLTTHAHPPPCRSLGRPR